MLLAMVYYVWHRLRAVLTPLTPSCGPASHPLDDLEREVARDTEAAEAGARSETRTPEGAPRSVIPTATPQSPMKMPEVVVAAV